MTRLSTSSGRGGGGGRRSRPAAAPDAETDVVKLTVEEAVARLPRRTMVHTFVQVGNALMGSETRRAAVEQMIKNSSIIEESGPAAAASGHGLCIEDQGAVMFIETMGR